MIKRLLHWFTRGRWYSHTLAGGWCPVCGAIHTYPGWLNPSPEDWRRCVPRFCQKPKGKPLWQVFAEEEARSKKK